MRSASKTWFVYKRTHICYQDFLVGGNVKYKNQHVLLLFIICVIEVPSVAAPIGTLVMDQDPLCWARYIYRTYTVRVLRSSQFKITRGNRWIQIDRRV